MNEKDIAKQMKALGISREEAIELLMEDEEVDRMSMKELNATLTDEQKKVQKAMTKTGQKKQTSYKFDKKSRPKDADKVELINEVHEDLTKREKIENLKIENEGQTITFSFNGADYSLTLTKHRKKKE